MATEILAVSRADQTLVSWLQGRRESCDMTAVQIPLRESKEWVYDGQQLRHRGGGFFSVVGAVVTRADERLRTFDQPLIHQPEIGILGFVLTDGAAGPDLVVQLKPEPGNVHLVQVAPTVQATESNYKRRHHGKATPFLEHFLNGSEARVLSDCRQSEQGTRFLGKYNRNVMVHVPRHRVPEGDDSLRCVPLIDVLDLLTQDFLINTDARSVLMCGPWKLMTANGRPFSRMRGEDDFAELLYHSYGAREDESFHTREVLLERLETARRDDDFITKTVSLDDLSGWELSEAGIASGEPGAFSIRQFEVSTTEREVEHWDQPLVASPEAGLAVLLCQEHRGVLHFLFNCSAEIGFRERYQYGPTVLDSQCGLVGRSPIEERQRELEQLARGGREILSCRHSDEGGRFFQCQSRYVISLIDVSEHVEIDNKLSWMTLGQIETLASEPGVFSNEARSLVSMLLGYL